MNKNFMILAVLYLGFITNGNTQTSDSGILWINSILSTSYPEAESFVGAKNGHLNYVMKADGIKYSYSIPFESIKRGEIVPYWEDYIVSLWCDDIVFYCVESETTENGRTIRSSDRLMNIYTGSKGEAETVLKFLSALSDRKANNDFYNVNSQAVTDRKVYICYSTSEYAYHSTNSCNGLYNCEFTIYEISEEGAINEGYEYCELCWE